MADKTSVAAGKQFSQDLRRIREDRGVSIEEVRKETRIARSLIESFEEGGLYDHETFNEVYLRSFVQAYAEAVGVSPERVRTELDAALEGTYQNALADEYLSESVQSDDTDADASDDEAEDKPTAASDRLPAPDESSSPAPPEAGGPEGRGGIVGPARKVGEQDKEEGETEEGETKEESSNRSSSEGSEKEDTKAADSGADEGPVASSSEEPPSEAPASESSTAETESPEEETEEDPDGLSEERRPSWMNEGGQGEDPTPDRSESEGVRDASAIGEEGTPPPQSGKGGETGIVGPPTPMGGDEGDRPASRPGGAPSTSPPRRSSRQSGWSQWFQDERRELVWAGIGFVVVFLVLVGLGIAFFTGESEPTSQPATSASTAPATDTAASPQDTTASSPSDQRRPPPADVTLGSSIPLTVRATNGVQGIRIKRDEDLIRPYWIEDGEAAVFPFQNRVSLENELENVQLFLAGYPYPEAQWDTAGSFVITRSEVEAFVDTLRGAPAALTTTPDTIPKGPPDQSPDQ